MFVGTIGQTKHDTKMKKMFSQFKKRPKKIKVLVVINGDTSVPVNYCSKVDAKLETEVRAACDSLSIPTMDGDVEKIVEALKRNESYWLCETWGFQIIEVAA